MIALVLDLLTFVCLLVGLFFLLVGAIGLVRLPDFFTRAHANSKCVTLGLIGLLLAAILHLAVPHAPVASPASGEAVAMRVGEGQTLAAMLKALLVMVFQFIAVPVGAHMLARAAHADGAIKWERTVADDLADDERRAGRRRG